MAKRISKYVAGYDGTKLAVDLYLPDTTDKVPVIFQVSNSDRRNTKDDLRSKEREELQIKQYEYFVEHGYAICRLEPRGKGASFGVSEGFWSVKDGKDIATVIDTIAAEDWCNGNAGMYGGSNVGASQHFAAKNHPKHLRCVIPCDCSADIYYQNYPNGVSICPDFSGPHKAPEPGIPVDEDTDGSLEKEARLGHVFNMNFLEQYEPNMHRDTVNPKIGYAPGLELPVIDQLELIAREDKIAFYPYGAFYDPGCSYKVFEQKATDGKLLLGPWRHCEVYSDTCDFKDSNIDWKADHLRFFDYYLKNEDNGVNEEPSIRYYTENDKNPWHYAADFPVDSQTSVDFHLTADGKISEEVKEAGSIEYTVRNDITLFEGMGRLNRRVLKDLTEENKKCVTFTTDTLEKDLELTGFPVVKLYVTSTYTDGIFMAALEEVKPDGSCHFLTDGMIRGRSAKVKNHPIISTLGLPYHSSLLKDDVSLSETEPTMLAFHMEVMSHVISKGSKLRLAIYCGGNRFNQPENMPENTKVTFHFGGKNDSILRLPVVLTNVTEFTAVNKNCAESVYAFKRAVYVKNQGRFKKYPCKQVYPEKEAMLFITEKFVARRVQIGNQMELTIDACDEAGLTNGFVGIGELPDRLSFEDKCTAIKPLEVRHACELLKMTDKYEVVRDLYVATVPVSKSIIPAMNPQRVNTLDLYINLIRPKGEGSFPCIVNIHGFGGNNQQFEPICEALLDKGYAVASVDYRLMPPGIWPDSWLDTCGCIRYLKAHATELKLDAQRFGVAGGSMGGHLSAFVCACSNNSVDEGDVGGNTEFDSSVKAGIALYGVTNLFTFGEDAADHWPHRADKVANGDGEYAPVGTMIGYNGPGKGMGELKTHLLEDNPDYQKYIDLAKDASAVSHVTSKSAPTCFVHGIYNDCGIQVPMGQSIGMFKALTNAGVKSLVLLNNNCIYGHDPEIQLAEVEFLVKRV